MKSSQVAKLLADKGFPIIGILEPNALVDGMVEITANVHVQVPLHGNGLNVVWITAEGEYEFEDVHEDMDDLLDDIRKALKKVLAGQKRK
jgi:hypothetical protein